MFLKEVHACGTVPTDYSICQPLPMGLYIFIHGVRYNDASLEVYIYRSGITIRLYNQILM